MIFAILWVLSGIVIWPFVSRYMLKSVVGENPETDDYYIATILGLWASMCWPILLPIMIIVFGGKRIIFGSTK